jgi:hypothetical protein
MPLLRSTFMLIWLFLLVFAPIFQYGGVKLNSSYLFIFFPGIIGFLHFYFKKEKNAQINNLLRILIISGIFLFMRQSVVYFKDITIIRDLFIGFVLFFSCYYFVKLYRKIYKYRFHEKMLNDLYLVGLAHAFIVVATFLYPSIKSVIYEFIWVTPKATKYLLGEASGYRFSGIVQSGFSFLSTTHALFFVLGIINFKLKSNPSFLRIGKYIFYQLIIFLSILLIGRTGLLLLIVFYSVYSLFGIFKYLKRLLISKKLLKTLVVLFLVTMTLFSMIDFSYYQMQLNFAFEVYYYFLETGRIGSTSTDILLQKEYFLPSNLLEILVGTGNYAVASDSGWVRFIYGSGMVGIIIAYAIYYFSAFYAYKYFRAMPLLAIFIMFYFVILIPLNLKDVYFYAMGSTQIFFLIIFTFIFFVEQKYKRPKSLIKIGY